MNGGWIYPTDDEFTEGEAALLDSTILKQTALDGGSGTAVFWSSENEIRQVISTCKFTGRRVAVVVRRDGNVIWASRAERDPA